MQYTHAAYLYRLLQSFPENQVLYQKTHCVVEIDHGTRFAIDNLKLSASLSVFMR